MHMKDRLDRTKAVLRHLPPGISQSALMEQIDARFASRYRWFCFRAGNNSQKNQRHARAYIDFNNPEDVIEFADFFTGHVFVNEKGAQFKTIVEYAPSQRAPKSWSKKDGREGTIFKDPEYLEFLDRLAKPVENLPSAEIQLERKEAEERAGGQKETLIVTPLMDFVRQKRAAKIGSQRQSTNGKLSRRGGGISPGNSSSASTKRASEKRRAPTSMYVLRGTKSTSGKEGSTYLLMQRRDDQQLSEKSVAVGAATEILDDEAVPAADYGTTTGVSGAIDIGKKRLLLKGKEKELSLVSGVVSPQQSITVRNSQGPAAFKQNQRRERDVSGRIIRSILSNKDARHNQSPVATLQSEQQMQTVNLEKDKRPPRPNNIRSILKDHVSPHAVISDGDTKRASDDKFVANDLHNVTSVNEKQDRRTRNKDRPDRGVWTPLRRSDGSHASDGSLPSSSLHAQFLSDSFEGMTISQQAAAGVSKTGDDVVEDTDSSNNSFTGGKPRSMDGGHNSRLGRGGGLLSANEFTLCEMKVDMPNASKSGEIKVIGTGLVNGSHRHVVRRGPHGLKEIDGSPNFSEGKPSKRGGTGYGSHEKQVWVQKSGSGS